MDPQFIRLCAQTFYGWDIPLPRAAELAEEIEKLVDGAQCDGALPGFEDSPDRFLVALLDAAKIGVIAR